ncbi:MAG: dockerin type I repeat-containing protein [Prevotella sp.]|nr:dockerin type I repeat-containing protein [Prevotella sp.]
MKNRMMMKYNRCLYLFLMLWILATGKCMAQYYGNMFPGQTKDVTFYVNASRGYQFELSLAKGLSFVPVTEDGSFLTFEDETQTTHTASVYVNETDRSMRCVVYSTTNVPCTSNVKIRVKAASDINIGEELISYCRILSGNEEGFVYSEPYWAYIVDRPIAGDITGSGNVDVQDATITVNYILGYSSGVYDYSLVDMNNDGEVDVFDVTAIINVILSGSSNPASARMLARQKDAQESINLTSDEKGLLFGIGNAGRFTSFQFDVEVPQGADILGVEWIGKTNHSLQFAKNGENRYTVVALSMESEPLPFFDSGLLRLSLSGTTCGEIEFSNILFVTPDGKADCFTDSKIGMKTEIQSVSYSHDNRIHDVSGRQIDTKRDQLVKGIYIINNKKVVIR